MTFYRETRVNKPEDLRPELERAHATGHLGHYSVDRIIEFAKEVQGIYGKQGLDNTRFEEKGDNRDTARGVVTFHTLHPTQPLDPQIPHGASCVFYADLDIDIKGAETPLTARFVAAHRRGPKAKNFENVYNDPAEFNARIKSGLIKPGTLGLIGGSIDPEEPNPRAGLWRETGEELGVVKENDKEITPEQIKDAISRYIPAGENDLVAVSASLDPYQEMPLLALGYKVNISEQLAAHLDKAAAVKENNRAFLAGEKSLEEWKKDGGTETLDYGIYPVSGSLQANAKELIEKVLREDMKDRQKKAVQLVEEGKKEAAVAIIKGGVDVDAMNLVTQGKPPQNLSS